MGYGEVGGNGSVHWKVDHEKGGRKLKVNPNNSNRPTGDDEVNADTATMGRDPVPVASVGKGDRKGYFNVRLRFDSRAEAIAELQRATSAIPADARGEVYVTVDVKAVNRSDPENKPDAEIRVDW